MVEPYRVLAGDALPFPEQRTRERSTAAGRATAAAVPGARFELVPKMGHFLPPDCWDALIEGIVSHASRVEETTTARKG